MTKTLNDYLNDPALANEPSALREAHAVRLMIYDETKGMTASEHTAYFHEGARAAFSRLGISPKYTNPECI
jgi:hypothetical protein